MARNIVGVDIGNASVRAVELSGSMKSRPTIVRYSEIALPPGAAQSGEVLETATVASALRRLWSTGGFSSKRVVLGVGNQRVLARDLVVPRMSMQQIRESLPFLVQDLIPVPVSEALLDFYPISEGEGESGPIVNGLLVAAVKEVVQANVKSVQMAGLQPVEVDLIPFALTRTQSRGVRSTGTVAIVDVGSAITNIVVTTGGVPQFVRIVPSGGDDLTKALAASLNVSDEVAVRMKHTLGLNPTTATGEQKAALEIIRKITVELLTSIRNTLSYYDNTHQTDPVRQIVLSGGGARLSGFSVALSELTRIEVVRSEFFGTFSASSAVKKMSADIRDSMVIALGLAIGGAA